MRNWSVTNRFLLSIIVFVFPLTAMVYLLYLAANEQALFSKKELDGIEILEEVYTFQNKIADRHFRAVLDNKDFSSDEVSDFKSQADSLLKKLDLSEKSTIVFMNSLGKYLKADISEKKGGGRFLLFQQQVDALEEIVADRFNIVLDPDLDSFYAMELMIVAIPKMRQQYLQLAQIIGNSNEVLYELQKDRLISTMSVYEENVRKIISNLDKIKNEDKAFYGELAEFQRQHPQYQESIRDQMRRVYGLMMNPDATLQNRGKSTQEIADLLNQADRLLDNIHQNFRGFVGARLTEILKQRDKKLYLSLISVLIAVLFSGYLGFTIKKTFSVFQEAVAKLKEQVDSSIEIGNSLSGAASRVSESSSGQAAAIEETSASLEEISSMVNTTTENSQAARSLAQAAQSHAFHGQQEMSGLLSSMREISASSQKIEEIIKIIDDIAFQTNLLALNASVEAARAGEHGKGFAVVADAVRSLAQKSAESAKETGSLISDSIAKIHRGHQNAEKSGKAMSLILESIDKVSSLNNEIAGASQEQLAGVQQISRAISDLEKLTLENSEISRQTQDFSQASLQQAEEVKRIISTLEGELKGAG